MHHDLSISFLSSFFTLNLHRLQLYSYFYYLLEKLKVFISCLGYKTQFAIKLVKFSEQNSWESEKVGKKERRTKVLMKSTPCVNFTNTLCVAFLQKFCSKLFCTYILCLSYFRRKNIGTNALIQSC
jgi:hypothetical protein